MEEWAVAGVIENITPLILAGPAVVAAPAGACMLRISR